MTIVLILIALALIAYYADPFGWDPSGRFGGATHNALAASLLFLLAGLGAAFYFHLIPTDALLAEYSRGLRVVIRGPCSG
jgi:hypothetical protein